MKVGVSPLANIIYAGKTRKLKDGTEIWAAREDITEQAEIAVFERFYKLSKESGKHGIQITGYGKLVFEREDSAHE